MRPGPLPAHGQPGDPSLAALAVLAAGATAAAAITLSPSLRTRLALLRPIPFRQRLRIYLIFHLRRLTK